MQGSDPSEQKLEMIVQLRHRAHGRARGAYRVGLIDGNSGWHTVDTVDLGLVHAVQKLAGIGGKSFDVAALAFGIQGVKD